jgi:hypothetical membrane protein
MNELTRFLTETYRFFGLAGCLVIIFAMLSAGAGYSGRKQEKYSPLNHFISELGEAGVSARAQVFNYGLIVGGALLIPFVIGFGVVLSSVWAILATVAGVWAAVSCILVGMFPMNNLEPHIKAAVSYFRSGLVMMLLFGIAILMQPPGRVKISLLASTASLLGVMAYGSFLFLGRMPESAPLSTDDPDPDLIPDRPRVWGMAVLEWLVFASTIVWFFFNAFLF